MLLPAAVRHLDELDGGGLDALADRDRAELVDEFDDAIQALEKANATTPRTSRSSSAAEYMRDTVIPAMDGVREVADRLEKLVADDLWPLPKYSEMLFIK